ncbi:iron(III) transport system ATP-binding protein [Spirosoma oryzae]|uniref:Iron(III) transport system ATP-binding protein n=1 Tax=Spirosoma oryzae TaxID=1469603 RepID=A0A2T0TNJ9_9BACT|nr:ABC transporter ATP-binding protein [Spirosoma oryzae]PRY47227.1 iron(III) transport system ATP-binding protein [Spirosoma oryzae]
MLIADKVSKTFDGGVQAVDDVSFSLAPGRIMGLVGASGSGKSTLLNMLAGLADVDSGAVLLNGKRVPGPSDVLIAGHPDIRLVHQEYQLMPNVSIRENINYAVRYFEKSYRTFRVDALLKLCRLTAVQDRLPRQVSGGEKQRTAIARAIADVPAVLLLDEPFSHLDLPNRLLVRDLLFELVREQQTACLFVTHDASDALSIADTIGILRDGQLIQLDTPKAVYHRPQTAYAAQLTGRVTVLPASNRPLLGLSESDQPDQWLCIRPEQVQLTESGVPATVRAVFFMGSQYELEVSLNDQVTLRVLTHRADIEPGQTVMIRVDADAVWTLPA